MNFTPAYPDIAAYSGPTQEHLDWLLQAGVPLRALSKPAPIRLAHGYRALDGLFDEDPSGPAWIVFPETHDCIYWQPRSGELASWNGAFALGEEAICNAGTYSLDRCLNIFSNPLDWLRYRRDGIVVLNWRFAFDHLRDAPRIAVAESLLPVFEQHMQPRRMPAVFVLRERKGAAA
ncbi:hypothetical protein CWR43_30770 [Rhizobium sullae]|uniref:Uncharacterized protein n=1 Tax=Rhizobium sullae TaxID=50338 RepID=A0A2N0D0K6_RHISU|nr:hypothetical protein [Rhizobium sullae]PKA39651.1 hypothetical protein CWR43_30770 [Rhizobium sullae]